MIRFNSRWSIGAACGIAISLATHACLGHFLWVKTIAENGKQHAFLFFGENVADEAYHLPEALADAQVWLREGNEERIELSLKDWEGEDRIGLGAPLVRSEACVLEAGEQYGVYGTALLTYWAKHVRAETAEQFNAAGPSRELKLDIVPRVENDELTLTVLWEGKPLAGAPVTIAVAEGEAVEKTTDEKGSLAIKPAGQGMIGVLANRKEEGVTGKLGDKSFNQGLHYSSLTFAWPVEPGDRQADAAAAGRSRPGIPALPEPLSSFGAVVVDGYVYVYGGHIGTEHDHSAANLSKHFRRVRIDGSSEWEELPVQTLLQGLPLVAHAGRVYRVGGLEARNPSTDEDEDLHSTAEFAEFDPETETWTALPPLPAARSSHNAVVMGDRLFVVGGWKLAGKSPGEWQQEALVYEFAKPGAGTPRLAEAGTSQLADKWKALPTPPFKRRALAASHWNGRLVVLGGIDEKGDVSQRVDMFDPETGTWSEGPELPGAGMAGFGVSAWNLNGRLYVSGLRGRVLRLNQSGSEWEEAARMKTGRFFHQLVPASDMALLAVGGASRTGHTANIEWIELRN